MASGWACQRRVEPATSVNRKQTVPCGGSVGSAIGDPLPGGLDRAILAHP